MTQNTQPKPRVRPPEVAAGYLVVRVRKMQAEEEGIVQAARLAHRAKIAALVAKQPAEVQKAFFALSGAHDVADTRKPGADE